MLTMRLAIVCIVLSVTIGEFVAAENPTAVTPKQTEDIKTVCASLNGSCSDCLHNSQCVWCEKPRKCFADSSLLPTSICSLKNTRRGVCTVSYRTVLIAVGSLAVILGLGITIACCCCCCRRSKSNQKTLLARDSIREERDEEERKVKHAARRADRQGKYDEIRKKYDLLDMVKCVTGNEKKDSAESESNQPMGDGFKFAPPVDDSIGRGVSTGMTTPSDGTGAATLLPPPLVQTRSKRSRMPRLSLSRTNTHQTCPYHRHGLLFGGSGHMSPFEARLRRRAREERRRREEREHQLELLAEMARMIAGTNERCQCGWGRPSASASLPALQARQGQGPRSMHSNCKDCMNH